MGACPTWLCHLVHGNNVVDHRWRKAMSGPYNECAPWQEIELEQVFSETCSESVSSGLNYSGDEPEGFVTDHDPCQTSPPAAMPNTIKVNLRRHLRVFCRSARACIRTESESVIANLTNISRSGLCFRTSEKFNSGATISIATHYIEGGENIFQSARIVRVRHSPSGNFADYGVEFCVSQKAAVLDLNLIVPREPYQPSEYQGR